MDEDVVKHRSFYLRVMRQLWYRTRSLREVLDYPCSCRAFNTLYGAQKDKVFLRLFRL